MKQKIFFITSIIILLLSCVKPQPQFPSNKGNIIDSTKMNLTKMNEVLAQKEDSLIQILIKKQSVPFTKQTNGLWYHKEIETNLDALKNDSAISFQYKCYTLTGELVKSGKSQIRFGKKETTVGLEEGLKLMKKGEKMQLIVPWYLAYGMKGEDNIPPYTSLIYEVSVDK